MLAHRRDRSLGTARKLDKLPETDKRARNGELSASQTNDIAGAAAADPTAEHDLLDLARTASAAELREEARRRRHAAAANDDQRHARIKRDRSLRTWTADDGSAHLHWNHLPEAGAEIGAILDDYIDDQFHTARRSGRREHRRTYAADAFIEALRDAAAFRRGESIHDDEADLEADLDQEDLGTDAAPDPTGLHQEPARASASASGSGSTPDPPGSRSDDHRSNATDARAPTSPDPAHGGHRHPDEAGVRRPPAIPDDAAPPGSAAEPEPFGAPRSPGQRGRSGRPPGRGRRQGAKRGPTRRRGADAKVIVRIDHTALVRGHTEAGDTCEIAGIGPVPVTSVRHLLDDAFLAAVITDGRDVTTVAHLGRQPNAYQQTALQAQGIECSTLGCPNRDRLERDHRIPWRVTHHTALRELDWSCPHCHDRKTHHGDMLAPGTGKRPLLTPTEQVQWNLDHPDNPVDPPQTTYPNRPTPTSGIKPSVTSTTPTVPPRRRRRPAAEALPFDP